MGLLSIFKRKTDVRAGAVPADISPVSVSQARARARQRLIGAVVLVVIGVIAFPLLFESSPRPIPVDIPIEIPRKEGAPTLVMPQARPTPSAIERTEPAGSSVVEEPRRVSAASAAPTAAGASASAPPAPAEAARPSPAALPQQAAPDPPATAKAAPAPSRAEMPVAMAPPATPAARPVASADAARAKALLEGKPQASKPTGGFVVQFGAFADAGAAQETRAKVDALGLKSYTQDTETAAGKRIRVRVGPFASREEAERVLIRAKAAGLQAAVLTP